MRTLLLLSSAVLGAPETPTPPAEPAVLEARLPAFEGGSLALVDPSGWLEVRDLTSNTLKWRVGLGSPAQHLVADARRIYVASGPFLRAFAGGISRWALDLRAPAAGLEILFDGLLKVELPSGPAFVSAALGRFCTQRAPCPGPPVSALGVPVVELDDFGLPGLRLVLSSDLLEAEPSTAPAAKEAPRARSVRSFGAGPSITLERGPSGKVRQISLGGSAEAEAPEVRGAPLKDGD